MGRGRGSVERGDERQQIRGAGGRGVVHARKVERAVGVGDDIAEA
jgi:hypothetical protein